MIGKVLSNRYKLLSELGHGGMSWVYLAQDLVTEQRVAVKVLYPQLGEDLGFLQRFTQEAKLVMGLADSLSEVHIVRVLDYGSDRDTRYLVMEYVEGRDLRRILASNGPLPWLEALDVARQVAHALDHAHQHGIVHRDIKPANIMVAPGGTVRILDFGIARARTSPTLTHSGFVGSPFYVAPEQAMGRRVDIRADLYSLGVVLYEMLTGDRPFESETPWLIINHHIATPPPPLEEVRPDLPPSLGRLLRKALAKRPEDRFQTPAEMAQAIEIVAAGGELHTDSWDVEPEVRAALLGSLYRQATQALADEEWSEAVDLFSQMLRLDPRYLDVTEQLAEAGRQARFAALYNAARLSISAGYWDDALAQLDELGRFAPAYRDLRELQARARHGHAGQQATFQGDLLLDGEKWAATIGAFDQAFKPMPGRENGTPPPTPRPAKQQETDTPAPVGPKRRPDLAGAEADRRRYLPWAMATLLILAVMMGGYLLFELTQSSPTSVPPSAEALVASPSAAVAVLVTPSRDATQSPAPPTLLPTDTPSLANTSTAVAVSEATHPPVAVEPTFTATAMASPTRVLPTAPASSPTPTPSATSTRLAPTSSSLPPTRTPTALPSPTRAVVPTAVPAPQGQIAFPRFDPARGTYDVLVCRVDGSDCRRVVSEASQPELLPDGTRIVVHSWQADNKGLILLSLSGQPLWKITDSLEAARPIVDSQGDSYVYHSRQEADRFPYLYRTDGAKARPILREANPVRGQSPSWLPDGRIVYSGCLGDNCGILVSRIDGTSTHQVVAGDSETNPEASPGGQRIAFMSQRDGNWEIYAVDLDGSNLRRLTHHPADDGLPCWSPDGRYLAFVSNRSGKWAIWVLRPDGTGLGHLFDLGGSVDGGVHNAAPHEVHGWVEEHISWSPSP